MRNRRKYENTHTHIYIYIYICVCVCVRESRITWKKVRENIKTLLLTTKGERVMHGELGTNIPIMLGQLFEPITQEETFENIRLEIETAIQTYLPYIRILNIQMVTQEEEPILCNNKIRINMSYAISDQSALVDNVDITLNNPES